MKINLEQAIDILNNESVVAIPTETVYGLAGKITSKKALNQIFQVKERPFYDPLIIHVSSVEMAKALFFTNNITNALMQSFWPGPLTIISKKTNLVPSIITAGLDGVGVRMPSHPLALNLIRKLNTPLAAPSANKFKKTSPTSAEHVLTDFNQTLPVLDGGNSEIGIESTVLEVIDENQIFIYRQGMISSKEIQRCLDSFKIKDVLIKVTTSKVSPGTMKDHYQPKAPLYIETYEKVKNVIGGKKLGELTLSHDPTLAARELYSKLRELSKTHDALYIDKSLYPQGELWQSIWDRLEKASTKKF